MYVLSLHQGHDSNVALVKDGRIVAAASEERFTRTKHYAGIPIHSLAYCLSSQRISIENIKLIVFPSIEKYDALDMLLGIGKKALYKKTDPMGETNFKDSLRLTALKLLRILNLWVPLEPPLYVKKYAISDRTKVLRIEHHLAHAASAYYASGFQDKTLVVTADGSGDGLATTVWTGNKGKLTALLRLGRNSSLGAFYGVVTEALGWWINDGAGKTMGLAPYGSTDRTRGVLDEFLPKFRNGKLARSYHRSLAGVWEELGAMHYHLHDADRVKKLVDQFGRENIAAEAQRCLEEELINLISYWIHETGVKHLAVSGGIFLNVKANQKIWESMPLKDFFMYPDAGDAGLSVGAALYGYYNEEPLQFRTARQIEDLYWGPSWTVTECEKILKTRKIFYQKMPPEKLTNTAAKLLADNRIIALFQGRMEMGPRALGNRSILINPLREKNKDIMNDTVKYREAFRPFCPTILDVSAKDYLIKPMKHAPFMIISFNVPDDKKKKIPAVVHIDGTVRPQILQRKDNPFFYDLVAAFYKRTGVPVLLNTSFNVKGEPIVCRPEDAIACFFNTGIDALILDGEIVVTKDRKYK